MANEAWIKRQTESPEARKRYEEERLILSTTEAIWKAMDDAGLTRADLAARLGTSRANVTQLLSGNRNMTLRSLAGLAHACGMRAETYLEELTDSVFTRIETVVQAPQVRSFSTAPAAPPLLLDLSSLGPISHPTTPGESDEPARSSVALAA